MFSTIARAWITLIALSMASAAVCDRATAQSIPQIVPDDTLGLESSELIDESPTAQLIRGGAQRQGNLFHSFERFNIDAGHQVYFANPTDVVRIFSRVTGAQSSDILGTLGVNGSADLFLLNPKGILLGPNAQLDVAGSFTASTANSVVFTNGSEFSAVAPEAPLLNLNVPPGVQFNTQNQPNGDLTNQADLAVGEGQTLTLFGNSVSSTVRLAAPNGNAQILGNQVELIDSATSAVSGPSGYTNLLVQAADDITVANIADDALLFASGTGHIILHADADADGVGDVVMLDLQETLQTNGRDLTVSGINLVLGRVNTAYQRGIIGSEIINIDANGPIPERGTEETADFTFTVPRGLGRINDLNVRFSAEHIYPSEVKAVLTSPSGSSLVLFDGVGGGGESFGENFQDTVLDDEASLAIEDGVEPFANSFQPQGAGGLAVFDGQLSEGTWSLSVTEYFSTDSGMLFQAGDVTPWGNAQGTQLLINLATLAAGEGDSGTVSLTALGDVSVTEVITANLNTDGDSGEVEINAGGDIAAVTFDARSRNSQGGDISLMAGGNIQVGFPSISPLIDSVTPVEAGREGMPGLINASGHGDGGSGGQVQLTAGGNITLLGAVDTSAFDTGSDTIGNGGTISLSAAGDIVVEGDLNSFTRSYSYSGSTESGNGGVISLSSLGNVAVGGSLNSSSFSGSLQDSGISGKGGAINLSATGDMTIGGSIDTRSNSFSSGPSMSGEGGVINLSASGNVNLGSFLYSFSESESNSNSSASGDGGTINLSATGDVTIGGRIDTGSNSNSLSASNSDTSMSGNGGTINLSASGDITIESELYSNSISFSSTGASASGDGGAITLFTSSNVTIEGELRSGSSSSSDTEASASGNGGEINLSALENVVIQDSLFSDSISFSNTSASSSGDGGDIILLSRLGDIQMSNEEGFGQPKISSIAWIRNSSTETGGQSNNTGNGGATYLRAPSGAVTGDGALLITAAVVEAGGTTGSGGKAYIEAASEVSDLEIVTLASGGNSGNVDIQGRSNSLTVENLSLIISGQVEISNPFDEFNDEVIILDLDNLGQSGNTHIDSTRDISLNNVNIEASANSNQPAGGVIVTSPGQVTFANSQITSNANSTGDAGTIRLDVGQLSIGNGGRIFAVTSDSGNGGNVIIDATDSVFLGEGVQDFEPVISVEASGAGRPGNIVINTPKFVLSETARITATATETATSLAGGGSISLNADQMDLAGIVGIFAETEGRSPGGTLTLQPYGSNPKLDIVLAKGAVVSASTSGVGQGGGLQILAPEAISISGPGRLAVETQNSGDGGDIEVRTRQLTLADGVELSASTFADAPIPMFETVIEETIELIDVSPTFMEEMDAGQTLNTVQIASDQAGIPLESISGTLLAEGDVDLYQIYLTEDSGFSASTVDGTSLDTQLFLFSAPDGLGVYSNDDANCDGCFQSTLPASSTLTPSTAGIYYLAVSGFGDNPVNELEELIFPDDVDFTEIKGPTGPGGTSSLTGWTGSGTEVGDYTIQLTGVAQNPDPIEVITTSEVETITAFLEPGDAGDINIFADTFNLANGATLQTNTSGLGEAGDININLSNSLVVDDSTITSSTLPDSTGAGGNITIESPITTLRHGGEIAVNSQGDGKGGQVTVTGDQLSLADDSRISATTLSSDGGNLTFDLQDLLLLRRGSEISTTAGTAGAGGDGGDITIDTRFIVAPFDENSDIVANAFDGNGGNVDITATGGLFGIEPRPERTPQNDITASSRNGVSGTVTVQTPNIDPSQDAVNLPTSPISSEVARSCRETYVQTGSAFVVTGRGGLPQGPLDSAATTLWQDMLPIAGGESEDNEQITAESENTAAIDTASISDPMVEVQGWTRNERGQVVLVAENPQQVAVGQPLACQG